MFAKDNFSRFRWLCAAITRGSPKSSVWAWILNLPVYIHTPLLSWSTSPLPRRISWLRGKMSSSLVSRLTLGSRLTCISVISFCNSRPRVPQRRTQVPYVFETLKGCIVKGSKSSVWFRVWVEGFNYGYGFISRNLCWQF